MKISITRALAELKTLRSRYESEVSDLDVIGVSVGKKMLAPYTQYTPEEFGKVVSSKYQSLIDIEKRIVLIKTKIDQSNFQTKVKIGETEMTVLEAIEMKNFIELKKDRLERLKSGLKVARKNYEVAIQKNVDRIEKNVSDQTSAGNKDKELEATIKESIEKLYPVSYIDPLAVEKKIEEEEKFISSFETEVDFVLSESNSLNYIEI
jgi:predicted polyphosphate/ATP-dependent NAD kinase